MGTYTPSPSKMCLHLYFILRLGKQNHTWYTIAGFDYVFSLIRNVICIFCLCPAVKMNWSRWCGLKESCPSQRLVSLSHFCYSYISRLAVMDRFPVRCQTVLLSVCPSLCVSIHMSFCLSITLCDNYIVTCVSSPLYFGATCPLRSVFCNLKYLF